MIFFKKKQPIVEQVESNGSPRAPRYNSWARVGINGFEGEALLRNISRGGFRMESRTFVAITIGEIYAMSITPEASTLLTPFDLEVEVRWVRSTESSFNAGFAVTKALSNRGFEKYVEYLEAHNTNVA
ncbi:MAG: PilZ domain-containing protein [Spirochaetaceae bacterium]|jgi:hypothetical protein|nr:PilZ domain-containing protein [Spirochaetaceae bacterium]